MTTTRGYKSTWAGYSTQTAMCGCACVLHAVYTVPSSADFTREFSTCPGRALLLCGQGRPQQKMPRNKTDLLPSDLFWYPKMLAGNDQNCCVNSDTQTIPVPTGHRGTQGLMEHPRHHGAHGAGGLSRTCHGLDWKSAGTWTGPLGAAPSLWAQE